MSTDNPHGSITNSHLELAGQIAHHDVLAQKVSLRGRTVAPLGDNMPNIVWHHKHSTATTGPAAYLLRLNSIHQRHYRYNSFASYIPGKANGMGDDPSRLWHLDDSQFLSHFNRTYPQAKPWQLAQLRPEMTSSIVSALLKQRPDPATLLLDPPTKMACGTAGKPLWLPSGSTPTSTMCPQTNTCLFSKFLPTKSASDVLRPAATLSELNECRTAYAPSPRRSVWGPAGAPIPAVATN